MERKKRKPTHPGAILKRHYLEPLGLTVLALAKTLALSRKTISKIINENGSITPDIALRLSVALDTSPQLWLNLQQNYDLWRASRTSKWRRRIHKIAA